MTPGSITIAIAKSTKILSKWDIFTFSQTSILMQAVEGAIVFFSDYLTIDFEEILKGFEEIFGESKHKENSGDEENFGGFLRC